jgi:hypothetical protein
MKRSSTFRVDHRPLRHKYRGVWGGAIVPGVVVLGFYASLLLDGWHGYDQDSATGRRLLDDEMRRQQKMQHALISSSDIDVLNATGAARDARIKAVYVELQSRADQLVLATSAFLVVAGLTAVAIVYMLWRRVDQLQAMLQPEAFLQV